MNKRFPSAMRGILVGLFLIATSSLQAADDRMVNLGRSLRCMCAGCQQLVEDCNHIGCPAAEPMRRELKQAVDSGSDDKTILAGFSAKYGPKVLSAPGTDTWLNLSAWIMPFAIFAAGSIAVIFSLKKFRKGTAAAEPAAAGSSEAPSPYDKEIEDELRKFTPED